MSSSFMEKDRSYWDRMLGNKTNTHKEYINHHEILLRKRKGKMQAYSDTGTMRLTNWTLSLLALNMRDIVTTTQTAT